MSIENRSSVIVQWGLGLGLAAMAVGSPAAKSQTQRENLPPSHLTMQSVMRVDLDENLARLPLHKGTSNGTTVWYVITDVSDERLARELGLNFAPRLANADTGCPGCIQVVESNNEVLGRGDVEFPGKVDFSPTRLYVPGPDGFPPLTSRPGSKADLKYSPLVRIAGANAVYNAPMVATGDGPFDVIHHTNTGDRVLRMNPDAGTVDLLFIRAFSNGKNIFYFNFEASDAGDAVVERSTYAPGLALIPFAGGTDNPKGTRAAIFTFVNGKLGKTSPPAQGLRHVAIDGLLPEEANLENKALIAALVAGADAHNVLDFFPTERDPRLAELYSPIWDLHVGVWSPDAVAKGLNNAQTDANQIRQLAAAKIVTNPGGGLLSSANAIINCPVFAFLDEPPVGPQAPEPPPQPVPVAD